jgi:hypothetical protein
VTSPTLAPTLLSQLIVTPILIVFFSLATEPLYRSVRQNSIGSALEDS